jgi:hypothetical protein
LFSAIDDRRSAETEENREELRRGIMSEIDAALNALPSMVDTERALIVDWINSSQDSWDLGDWGGMEAGNIYLSYNYWPYIGEGLWGIGTRPYIDDVSRPEGVKKALEHVFGAETFLHELPFQINLTVHRLMLINGSSDEMGTDRLIKPRRGDMQRQPGEAAWNLESGSESTLQAWLANPAKPKIRSLVSD